MKVQKLDKLGRLVIPVDYRKTLKLDDTVALAITLENDSVVIRPANAICKLCGAPLGGERELPLCACCIEKVKKLPQ